MMKLAWNYLTTVASPAFGRAGLYQAPDTSLESVREQTNQVAREIICYIAQGVQPDSPAGQNLRLTVDSLRVDYQDRFEALFREFRFTQENAAEQLQQIALFCLREDPGCNWGRVASLFTFAGLLARLLFPEGDEELLRGYSTYAGNLLSDYFSEWILREGGWEKGLELLEQGQRLKTPSEDGTRLFGYLGSMLEVGLSVAVISYSAIC